VRGWTYEVRKGGKKKQKGWCENRKKRPVYDPRKEKKINDWRGRKGSKWEEDGGEEGEGGSAESWTMPTGGGKKQKNHQIAGAKGGANEGPKKDEGYNTSMLGKKSV